MYRLHSGSTKRHYYYRCYGSGPQRKGCGNMVPLDVTEKLIMVWHALAMTVPYRTRVWVEGTNYDDEISEVKQDIRELVEAERFGELPPLQAKLEELRSRETVPGRYEYRDTGITEAEHFRGLDAQGRREYLASRDIRVEKSTTDDGSKGIRLVIDGTDYGVWPYPPM